MNSDDNELLTRVGPGTPMGSMLREFWVPTCRTEALKVDGAPQRVRLFGENFVVFRATDGRVGFLDEACPHRCVSLALAQNRDNGLRCIFHGWKFDVDGHCVDAPTEPIERRQSFAARVPVRSHPSHEAGGMVWVYLGAQKSPPPFPKYEFNLLPDSHVRPRRAIVRTNWLQGLEGQLDSAHITFLHSSGLVTSSQQTKWGNDTTYLSANGAPILEMDEKPYGFREAAIRQQPNGTHYARIREVALPFYSFIPHPPRAATLTVAVIPIDDVTCAMWFIHFDPYKPFAADWMEKNAVQDSGDPDYFNSDMGDADNLWRQDREAMKQGHWTGMLGRRLAYEDFAVQESMGSIVDRSKEFLSGVDASIVKCRRLLLQAVRDFQRDGKVPFREANTRYDEIRALSIAYPPTQDWREVNLFNPQASSG